MVANVYPSRARRRFIVRAGLAASDLLMLLVATSMASLVRFGQIAHVTAVTEYGQLLTFFDLSLVITAVWLCTLLFEHLYNLDRVFWGTGEYSRVIRALSVGVVAFILITYLLKLPGLSRGWTFLAWGFACVFVILGRSLVRAGLASARRRGYLLRPTLIVGANREAADIVRALLRNSSSGLVPVACLASNAAQVGETPYCADERVSCIGHASDVARVLEERFIDTVLIASSAFSHDVMALIISDLRDRDVDVQLSSGLFDVTTSRVMVRETAGIPLIGIRSVSFSARKMFVKRSFDLTIASLVVLLGMPIWLLVALAIKLESRGPVFYKQQRVGRNGKSFLMYKFRSMCDGADSLLGELSGANEATGPLFKIKADPRITRMGKWMRKFSLDEFPQLINVLRGEMSLVGPRPPLPAEAAAYTEYDWRRMEVLPGLTGLWQVSGRSSLTFEEMVRLDLFYIENWSLGMDIGLILRTIPAVVFARGAY